MLAAGPILKVKASCSTIAWLFVFAFDVVRPQPFINIILCSRGRGYSHGDQLGVYALLTHLTDSILPNLPHLASPADRTCRLLQSGCRILRTAIPSVILTWSKLVSPAAIQRNYRFKAMAHRVAGIHRWRSGDLPHLVRLALDCLD